MIAGCRVLRPAALFQAAAALPNTLRNIGCMHRICMAFEALIVQASDSASNSPAKHGASAQQTRLAATAMRCRMPLPSNSLALLMYLTLASAHGKSVSQHVAAFAKRQVHVLFLANARKRETGPNDRHELTPADNAAATCKLTADFFCSVPYERSQTLCYKVQ